MDAAKLTFGKTEVFQRRQSWVIRLAIPDSIPSFLDSGLVEPRVTQVHCFRVVIHVREVATSAESCVVVTGDADLVIGGFFSGDNPSFV